MFFHSIYINIHITNVTQGSYCNMKIKNIKITNQDSKKHITAVSLRNRLN